MINHIFYSLVLFPHITYDKKNALGYTLLYVYELDFGVMGASFLSPDATQVEVEFTYSKINTTQKDNSTKNWFISSNNTQLESYIIDMLKQDDETRDFNFFDDKLYNRSIPFGVVLTITSKCNIYCYYCFNDIDYDLKYRNTRDNYGFEYWKNIVDHLYEHGTRVIILTGGEPMVAPFLWELLDYLREKNMFVHINTNGVLLSDKILSKLNDNYSLNIMVSLHEFNNKDYYDVNKKGLEMTFDQTKVPKHFQTLFTDKMAQLRKVKHHRNLTLELLTILVWKNILNLEKIYEFGKNCGVEYHAWQFFRLYGTKNNLGASKSMMELAINKMYLLNKKYEVSHKIVDPVPYCVTKNIHRASQVIDGVLSDSHDVKTIITTQGYVQMMSAYDNNYWNIGDTSIREIFDSEFVHKQLNNGFLPKECLDCKFMESCRGGSRMDANIAYGDYGGKDPIADFENKIVI